MESSSQIQYRQARETLLAKISATLKDDPRFVAAWLAGSFGRGEQDWFSDLDLHVVVAHEYSETLCSRPWQAGAKTTEARLALFRQFGEPAIVYDAHGNNRIGGTFTYVLYQPSAINIDWMLIPQELAYREPSSLLLFNKIDLPQPAQVSAPDLKLCIEEASMQVGFFWMIAAACIKWLIRKSPVHFHLQLCRLEDSIRAVQALLQGGKASYTAKTNIQVYTTVEAQVAVLRALCDEMEALMPQVVAAGGYVPATPRSVVEKRIGLLD